MKNARTTLDQPEPRRRPHRNGRHSSSLHRAPETTRPRRDSRSDASNRCTKVRYRDHQHAVQALHRARNARDAQLADTGTTRRRETRTYECHRCHGHHLTSREEW